MASFMKSMSPGRLMLWQSGTSFGSGSSVVNFRNMLEASFTSSVGVNTLPSSRTVPKAK